MDTSILPVFFWGGSKPQCFRYLDISSSMWDHQKLKKIGWQSGTNGRGPSLTYLPNKSWAIFRLHSWFILICLQDSHSNRITWFVLPKSLHSQHHKCSRWMQHILAHGLVKWKLRSLCVTGPIVKSFWSYHNEPGIWQCTQEWAMEFNEESARSDSIRIQMCMLFLQVWGCRLPSFLLANRFPYLATPTTM